MKRYLIGLGVLAFFVLSVIGLGQVFRNTDQILNASYSSSAVALRANDTSNPNPLGCDTPSNADQVLNCVYDPATTSLFVTVVGGGVPGTGTVTDFSAGTLSPIFTTSVATSTSTPALTFALSTVAKNKFLAGPVSGADAAPTYRFIDGVDLPALATVAFAALLTQPNGTILYCSDCDAPTVAGTNNTCTSAGAKAGAEAHKVRGAWQCY